MLAAFRRSYNFTADEPLSPLTKGRRVRGYASAGSTASRWMIGGTPEVNESEDLETDERSLEELRERADERAQEIIGSTTTTIPWYSQSTAIKDYVLARAGRICETCGEPAPSNMDSN